MLGALNRHFFLALMVSTGAILVLLRGAGVGGPYVTGILLIATMVAVFVQRLASIFIQSTRRVIRYFRHQRRHLLCHQRANCNRSGTRACAYSACRLFPKGEFTASFVWATSAIAGVGAIATAYALITQWGDQMSKPVVFGYDHAATTFLLSLGFALIALVSQRLDARRTRIICTLVLLPIFIFSASMVRFIFAALIVSLFAAARRSDPSQRRHIHIIMLTVVLATSAGFLTRYQTWAVVGSYFVSEARSAEAGMGSPEGQCGVIINESLGVRRILMGDALRAIPAAGFFGLGFTNYKNVACFKGFTPHNSVLQAFVEFGWVGGLALAGLIGTALIQLWRPARSSNEARTVFCCLVFVTLIHMAHGSIAHAALLFLFLGYASRIYEDSFYYDPSESAALNFSVK